MFVVTLIERHKKKEYEKNKIINHLHTYYPN
jgi:hypothetical protein